MTDPAPKKASTLYLWPLRTLYIGEMSALPPVSMGAHALLFGLEHALTVNVGGKALSQRSFLVSAGTTVSGDPGGQRVACCFLDPLGRDYAWLRPRMAASESGVYWGDPMLPEQLAALAVIDDQGLAAADSYRHLTDVLFPSPQQPVDEHRVDERIARVVELIRADPANNISNDELGASVALSGTRLQRLFKQTTGVPIRRYRLWHRLFVTASMMSMGSTLTDAALAAGFSDSSHLNHVFKSMLGMKPSLVLRRSRTMRILVGAD